MSTLSWLCFNWTGLGPPSRNRLALADPLDETLLVYAMADIFFCRKPGRAMPAELRGQPTVSSRAPSENVELIETEIQNSEDT